MDLPNHISLNAAKATANLLPAKSKIRYDQEYSTFMEWKVTNDIEATGIDETVMLAYFQELSEKFAPNSLWAKYSMLKTTLIVNTNVDIGTFKRLVVFLKNRSKGYVGKKSKVLEADHVQRFIRDAPDNLYLLHKVVLLMGVFGALRRDELLRMTIDDVDDKGSYLLVKVPITKTGPSTGFSVVDEDKIGALDIIRKYITLRAEKAQYLQRFFLTYRNGRCTAQPVGKNTLGSVPATVAKYLGLSNWKEYTGHCLRRTSAILLVGAGASFETLKMHGKWKSSSVAEGYIEESVISKNKVSNLIINSLQDSTEPSSQSTSSKITSTVNTPEQSQTFSGKFSLSPNYQPHGPINPTGWLN